VLNADILLVGKTGATGRFTRTIEAPYTVKEGGIELNAVGIENKVLANIGDTAAPSAGYIFQ